MAKFELKLPKMGESVDEATLTTWLVEIGDSIEMDDGVLEVSTDKVDTELPTEVSGILIEKRFEVDAIIKVGDTIAIIETDDEIDQTNQSVDFSTEKTDITPIQKTTVQEVVETISEVVNVETPFLTITDSERFYSPLVRSIAQKERISQEELDSIKGSGIASRLTKDDLFGFLKNRSTKPDVKPEQPKEIKPKTPTISINENDEVVPMDRMGKLIAKHMVNSIQTSVHVQSFIEIDVTNIVNWRNRVKEQFLQEKDEKLTYTPIFMQAIAQTIKEYPMVNISVNGTDIIKKKDINLGMAAALPNGNLIVPVIKKASELNLVEMAIAVNKLASKAREGKLSPDDIQGGTYTVTNVGSFGSITGTPIINQPQVAILALGAIRKMPAVIESPEGDIIGIRHQMIVAHSYDHRVVNGALGGQFILRLKEILENFDVNQNF